MAPKKPLEVRNPSDEEPQPGSSLPRRRCRFPPVLEQMLHQDNIDLEAVAELADAWNGTAVGAEETHGIL